MRYSTKRFIQLAWSWFAHLSAMSVISGGIAYALIQAFAVNGPAIASLDKQGKPCLDAPCLTARDVTTRVPVGGALSFTVEFQRFESCPGVVVESYWNLDGPSSRIVRQRPALSYAAKKYEPTRVTIELPTSVTQGRWKYIQTVKSDCPTGKRLDPFTEFEFETYAS